MFGSKCFCFFLSLVGRYLIAKVPWFAKKLALSFRQLFFLALDTKQVLSKSFTMSGVSVLQHFEVYQKARVSFVQAVADGATRPQNIEVMQNAGVMQLLRPLLLDNVRK